MYINMDMEMIALFFILGLLLSLVFASKRTIKKIEDHVEGVKLENIRLLDILTDLTEELKQLKEEKEINDPKDN